LKAGVRRIKEVYKFGGDSNAEAQSLKVNHSLITETVGVHAKFFVTAGGVSPPSP